MKEKIENMLQLLDEEQRRAKEFVNLNGFDCTTAPFVIVKAYRDAIKRHMEVLRINLDD